MQVILRSSPPLVMRKKDFLLNKLTKSLEIMLVRIWGCHSHWGGLVFTFLESALAM